MAAMVKRLSRQFVALTLAVRFRLAAPWVCSSMVEQWPLKPLVESSSLSGPTKLRSNELRLASHPKRYQTYFMRP